jgi:hypothetical protein
MAMAVCRCNRATPEATGRRHQATICSVFPQQSPRQQANKQQSTNTPTKLTILMAMAMCRYITTHIAQWRRSRALLEATGRRHRASIMPDNIKGTWLLRFLQCFHPQNHRKSSQVDAKTPVFNRGMTYQTKEKGLIKVSIYFFWEGLIDKITYGGVVVVLHLYLLEQCPELPLGTLIKTCNFIPLYKLLSHLCMHHTI